MGLTPAARGLLLVLLSLPALQGGDWAVTYTSGTVCALKGSQVELSCTLHRYEQIHRRTRIQEGLWFAKGQVDQWVDVTHDTRYAGRVEYRRKFSRSSRSETHTLSMRDLRQSDSTKYRFRFKTNQPDGEHHADPGVRLSVTDLQVNVSNPRSDSPTWAVLECLSGCVLPGNLSYSWFRSGQPVGEGTFHEAHMTSEDSYSCAVKGQEGLPSPFVYAPKTPSVMVRPSGGIAVGSAVTLSCRSDANPAAKYTWFRDHGGSVEESGPHYTISHITSELGGNYYCQARNGMGHHNSTFLFINVIDPSFPETWLTTSNAARICVVSLTTILLICLWMRKMRTSRATSGLEEDLENVSPDEPDGCERDFVSV